MTNIIRLHFVMSSSVRLGLSFWKDRMTNIKITSNDERAVYDIKHSRFKLKTDDNLECDYLFVNIGIFINVP